MHFRMSNKHALMPISERFLSQASASQPKLSSYPLIYIHTHRLDPAAGQLVMLYKLQPGVCPQSYGMECGLRAGLPEHIITRARIKSAEFEAEQQSKAETHSFAAAAAAHGVESGRKRRRDDGDEELHTLQKARAILDVIPNGSQPLQGREALAVYRKLAEIWDSLAP